MKKYTRGFTLIELLVVIAIIGILSSVVLVSLNSARSKGGDAAVRGNISGIRSQAELWSADNNNSYNTTGSTISSNCTTQTSGSILADATVKNALLEAGRQGGGTVSCVVLAGAGGWGVAASMKTAALGSFCVDSAGNATTTTNATPVNGTTARCQ